jgi:hypothetical protein
VAVSSDALPAMTKYGSLWEALGLKERTSREVIYDIRQSIIKGGDTDAKILERFGYEAITLINKSGMHYELQSLSYQKILRIE